MKKLIIAGGSGFLGNAIANYFKEQCNQVVILSRAASQRKNGIRYVQWDGKTKGMWISEFKDCDVLINMAGKSVDCRYTPRNKKEIMDSRILSTLVLGEVIASLPTPPKVWINSSTATIYRYSEDKQMDEASGELGTGFSVSVAKAWEESFFSHSLPITRRVALRTAIVLAKDDGAFVPIKMLAKFGMGGRQGSGRQIFSWIHINDFLRAIEFCITHETMEAAVNLSAPKPITNAYLMQSIRKALKMPFGLPLSAFMLEIGARIIQTEPELVLKSRNVIPGKLTRTGFIFEYETMEAALEDLI